MIIGLIPARAARASAYKPDVGRGAAPPQSAGVRGWADIIVPFIGIKIIDLAITAMHLALQSRTVSLVAREPRAHKPLSHQRKEPP